MTNIDKALEAHERPWKLRQCPLRLRWALYDANDRWVCWIDSQKGSGVEGLLLAAVNAYEPEKPCEACGGRKTIKVFVTPGDFSDNRTCEAECPCCTEITLTDIVQAWDLIHESIEINEDGDYVIKGGVDRDSLATAFMRIGSATGKQPDARHVLKKQAQNLGVENHYLRKAAADARAVISDVHSSEPVWRHTLNRLDYALGLRAEFLHGVEKPDPRDELIAACEAMIRDIENDKELGPLFHPDFKARVVYALGKAKEFTNGG